jgi:ankyrin repeat protein
MKPLNLEIEEKLREYKNIIMPIRSTPYHLDNDEFDTETYAPIQSIQTVSSVTNINVPSNEQQEQMLSQLLSEEPSWVDKYVVLVYTKRDSITRKYVKEWREFSLPLIEHQVEQWCNLCRLTFYEVPTFATSISLTNRNKSFSHFKKHIVNDRSSVDINNLVHGHCYMVCGNVLQSVQEESIVSLTYDDNVGSSYNNYDMDTFNTYNYSSNFNNSNNDDDAEAEAGWSTGVGNFFQNNSPISQNYPATYDATTDDPYVDYISANNDYYFEDEGFEAQEKDTEQINNYSQENERNFKLVTDASDTAARYFLDTANHDLENALIQYYECLTSPVPAFNYNTFLDPTDIHRVILEVERKKSLESQYSLELELRSAIKNKNIDKLDVLLGLSPAAISFERRFNGDTLLMIASLIGNNNVLARLLEKSVFKQMINQRNEEDGWTALHYAAGKGNIDCVETLLDSGADPTILDNDGGSFLHLALSQLKSDIVPLCIQKIKNRNHLAAIVKPQLNNIETPLTLAIHNGLDDAAKLLIENIPELNVGQHNDDKKTALMMAAKRGKLDLVKAILDTSTGLSSINNRESFKKTALIYAAKYGHFDIVKELVSKNANLNQKDSIEENALTTAISKGHLDIAKFLIESGCDVTGKVNGVPLVQFCTISNYTDILAALGDRGIDLNEVEEDDEIADAPDYSFPLYSAAAENQVDIVKQLLTFDYVEVSKQHEITGATALHIAAAKGHIDVVLELLNHLAIDIDIQDVFGRTPLHTALYYKQFEVAQVLQISGAKVTIRDLSGIAAGCITDDIANNSEILNSDQVDKIKFLYSEDPKGKVFTASFRNKTVELIEYPIHSRVEALQTYKALIQLKQNIPRIYNRILPTLEKAKGNNNLYTLFPQILGFYFDAGKVGIVMSATSGEHGDFIIHDPENRNVLLKMDLSINLLMEVLILHRNSIIHGNINQSTTRRIDGNNVLLRSFGLPCTVDYLKPASTVAPEVQEFGYEALSKRSDTLSAGVTLFQLMMKQMYDPGKTNYEQDNKNIIPDKIMSIIVPMLRPDPEIRTKLSLALEALLRYRQELLSTDELSDSDILKEVKAINIGNHVIFVQNVRAKYDAYSFKDRKEPIATYATNTLASKCIIKLKETISNIELSSGELSALDKLDTLLSSTTRLETSVKQQLVTDDTYSLFNKLINKMADPFMILDLFRLFVLDADIVSQLIVSYSYVLDTVFELFKNYSSLSTNSKMMINRFLCNFAADVNGRNYLISSTRRDLTMNTIGRGLIFKSEEKTAPAVRVSAASIVFNLRYDINKPIEIESIVPSQQETPQLHPEMKKLVIAILLAIKSPQPSFAEEILQRLSVTLYCLMKQDDLILSLVLSRSDFSFDTDIKPLIETNNLKLASALSSLLSLKSLEFDLINKNEE